MAGGAAQTTTDGTSDSAVWVDHDATALAAHGLPSRWQGKDHFVVLITCFGQGDGLMAIWAAWRADPHRCDRLTVIATDPAPRAPRALPGDGAAKPPWMVSRLASRWPPMTPG